MAEPTCKTCRFWSRDTERDQDEFCGVGDCRRYPPVLLQSPELLANEPDDDCDDHRLRPALFPETYDWDWCGEHQPSNHVEHVAPPSID